MKDELLSLWYHALAHPNGIAVSTNNPISTKSYLYRVRRDAADPDLDSLIVIDAPDAPGDALWIVPAEKVPQ